MKKRSRKRRSRVALVCAGGGVTGAVYEIGCLAAIEETLDIDLTSLDCYVGVSGGAFVTSLLASGFTASEIYREIAEGGARPFGVPAADVFRVGIGEYARRALRLPRATLDAFRLALSPDSRTLTDVARPFLEVVPAGLLDNGGVPEFLEALFARYGRSNRFEDLAHALRIVAVDLDRGETVAFGDAKHRDVTISRAVQASTALPGLYRPVRLGGRDYIDGGVTKTAHINLAIREGCDLVICVNPLVPFLNSGRDSRLGPLAGHGLDTVLGQVLRLVLHGRFEYGMERYRVEHPDVDILLIEPSRRDVKMFQYDIMRYSARRALAQHGRQSGLEALRGQRRQFARLLSEHGLHYRRETKVPNKVEPSAKRSLTVASLDASLDRLERAIAST